MPSDEAVPRPSVAVAIPAYNEDGIEGFLLELDKHMSGAARSVDFYVVDDASIDDMPARLEKVADELGGRLHVSRNAANSGHGPTLLAAYRAAVASGADVVFQVDGDGQFDGEDAPLLLDELANGADVAAGTRRSRVDPWFRRGLSLGLRVYLRTVFGVSSADPNCPFRAYLRKTLDAMLAVLPPEALVPNVYLTIVAGRRGLDVVEVPVRHRVRRGESTEGTMWGNRSRAILVPRRLVSFARRALAESIRTAPTLRRQRPHQSPGPAANPP